MLSSQDFSHTSPPVLLGRADETVVVNQSIRVRLLEADCLCNYDATLLVGRHHQLGKRLPVEVRWHLQAEPLYCLWLRVGQHDPVNILPLRATPLLRGGSRLAFFKLGYDSKQTVESKNLSKEPKATA